MKKKFRLTKREKFIVAATDPTFEGFATQKEVDMAYKKARGHCFDDKEFESICAVSPTGRKAYLAYNWYPGSSSEKMKYWWNYTLRCARLWAQGRYKEASQLFHSMDTK